MSYVFDTTLLPTIKMSTNYNMNEKGHCLHVAVLQTSTCNMFHAPKYFSLIVLSQIKVSLKRYGCWETALTVKVGEQREFDWSKSEIWRCLLKT